MRRGILWLLFGLLVLLCFVSLALAEPGQLRAGLKTKGQPSGGSVRGVLNEESWSPSAAYDPENNRYMVVYEHVSTSFEYQIFGKLVTLEGTSIGDPFVVSNGSTNQRVQD